MKRTRMTMTLSLILAATLPLSARAGKITSGSDGMPAGAIWQCESKAHPGLRASVDFIQNVTIELPNGEIHEFPRVRTSETKFVFDGNLGEKALGFATTFLILDRELAETSKRENGSTRFVYSEKNRSLPNRGFVAGLSIYLNQPVESNARLGAYRARMSIKIATTPVLLEEMICAHSFPTSQPDPLLFVK